ncbi:flagellar basal body P-ring formation chaperone FlgA [Rhodocyclus gracilis]|uniref:flagellar basal body P-ring formation chaperone FlgA n=1 Tax=Rhodocyclus gracilis TaxID=2929842 RepID=UPI001E3786C2|nr:flagellar basal body P-ring formation chaperone FlgA [Rhodocyclus gracilis]
MPAAPHLARWRHMLPALLATFTTTLAHAHTTPQTAPNSQSTQPALTSAIDDYLRAQTRGLPGKVSYRIGSLDPRIQLAACSAFEPFLPAGGRLWGKATVGVRCLGPASWVVYVPVDVNISGSYFVSARPLAAGQPLSASDIVERQGDLGGMPATVVTDAAQAIGKTPRSGLGAGQPLRSDLLLAPWAVQQGQNVKLISRGAGFSASSDGRALNNAADGQVVQVRGASGQTITGIARTGGIVEVNY